MALLFFLMGGRSGNWPPVGEPYSAIGTDCDLGLRGVGNFGARGRYLGRCRARECHRREGKAKAVRFHGDVG